MENKLLQYIGMALIAISIVIVVFFRAVGVDLTEGQMLIEYLPWWVFAAGLAIGGAIIYRNAAGS